MNKKLYTDHRHNAVRLSEFDYFKGETSFSNVAAKFVVKGQETYRLNQKKFVVSSGEYIIGNNNQLSEVHISEQTVGLCVDIANDMIVEILSVIFDNPDLHDFLLTDRFLVNKYHAKNTTLGYKLNELSGSLLAASADTLINQELLYSIGESVVIDQAVIFEQLSRLNFKKQTVSDEVFRHLLLAKRYIDDCYLMPLHLEQLVEIALMSKYAFIRLFKQTFGVTPYHYVLQKRLLHAKQLLAGGTSVFDAAQCTCFADTPSFSKAFKQYFGYSPSRLPQ